MASFRASTPVVGAPHPAVHRRLPAYRALADGAGIVSLRAAAGIAHACRLEAGFHQPLRHGAPRHPIALVHTHAALHSQKAAQL